MKARLTLKNEPHNNKFHMWMMQWREAAHDHAHGDLSDHLEVEIDMGDGNWQKMPIKDLRFDEHKRQATVEI